MSITRRPSADARRARAARTRRAAARVKTTSAARRPPRRVGRREREIDDAGEERIHLGGAALAVLLRRERDELDVGMPARAGAAARRPRSRWRRGRRPAAPPGACQRTSVAPSIARSSTRRAAAAQRGLALRVLRALARLVPAVLLALDLARVARDEAGLLERGAELRVDLQERARDAVADGDGLRARRRRRTRSRRCGTGPRWW